MDKITRYFSQKKDKFTVAVSGLTARQVGTDTLSRTSKGFTVDKHI